jgi:hypothetical protein
MELVISFGSDLPEDTASQLQRSVGLCLEGTSEHGNEPSRSIKGGEFLDYLSDCQLLKKDSAPWSQLVNMHRLTLQMAAHSTINSRKNSVLNSNDHSPPSSAEVKEFVGLYLHSPIRLHGVVLG